jgi:uncharacterized protein (DUF1684 family)
MSLAELELASWRREMSGLFGAIRRQDDPVRGHEIWREGRDELFRNHPQSPLLPDDPLRETGLPCWPYDPSLRFTVAVTPVEEPARLDIPTGDDSITRLVRVGRVHLPGPFDADLDVWWLDQYAGGIFIPLRDGSAGDTSYGGGRYALDTAKGADHGGDFEGLVLDLNFLYHPSCRYNPAWVCPLAPPGNTISTVLRAGERLVP